MTKDEIQRQKSSLFSRKQELSGQNRKVLTGRNPFKMDEDLINYDQNSEDEWNDMLGENLSDEQESEQDSIAHSAVEEGFIVGDDDFSDTSFVDSDEANLAHKRIELILKRENRNRLLETRKAIAAQVKDVEVCFTREEKYKACILNDYEFTFRLFHNLDNDVAVDFPLNVMKK
jgi:hypothetical protein